MKPICVLLLLICFQLRASEDSKNHLTGKIDFNFLGENPGLRDQYLLEHMAGKRPFFEVYYYQQVHLKSYDVLSDYVLAFYYDRTSIWGFIKDQMSGGKKSKTAWIEFEKAKENVVMPENFEEWNYLDDTQNYECFANLTELQDGSPLEVEGMVRMLKQVAIEESANGLKITPGYAHDWSLEFIKKFGDSFPSAMKRSKIILALAAGISSRFMVTGYEHDLVKFILKQPPSSITIPEMFRTSLRLSGGDVYKALLTIENVLSRYWLDSNRELLAITSRLSSITHGEGIRENKFGAWYHLFGLTLYSFVYGESTARTVAWLEVIGNQLVSGFKNGFFKGGFQESHVNLDAASIGGRFREWLIQSQFQTEQSQPENLKPEKYLRTSALLPKPTWCSEEDRAKAESQRDIQIKALKEKKIYPTRANGSQIEKN